MEKLKKNIKKELKERNKTIQDLAKVLGKDRNFICRLSAGSPIIKIIDIAHAIGCKPSDLLEGL